MWRIDKNSITFEAKLSIRCTAFLKFKPRLLIFFWTKKILNLLPRSNFSGIEGRQVLPEARFQRPQSGGVRGRGGAAATEMPARGLRRPTPPGQLDAQGSDQDEHAVRWYSLQSVSRRLWKKTFALERFIDRNFWFPPRPSPSLKQTQLAVPGVPPEAADETGVGTGAGNREDYVSTGSLAGSIASTSSGFGSLPKKRPTIFASGTYGSLDMSLVVSNVLLFLQSCWAVRNPTTRWPWARSCPRSWPATPWTRARTRSPGTRETAATPVSWARARGTDPSIRTVSTADRAVVVTADT